MADGITDFPATLYIQETGDRKTGLVMNRTPEGTLKQRIRNAGEVVAVYKLEKLVKVSVAPQQVSVADVVPTCDPQHQSRPPRPAPRRTNRNRSPNIVSRSIEESITDGFAEVAQAIREFTDRAFPRKLPTPKTFEVILISERRENDMDILKYRANFPTVPSGTDVTTQKFAVAVEGQASDGLGGDQELGADATSAEFEVPQDANVTLKLIYVDDAGNESAPRTQEFVAKDTIAPDAPGDFGAVDLISERTEP